MAAIDEPVTVPITVTGAQISAPSAGALLEIAMREEMEIQWFDDLPWISSHSSTPEEVLLSLCDRGLCLDELGHRTGPRKLLEKMADVHQYPEAIITLASELYTNPEERLDSFVSFVHRHADSLWMLESLAERDTSSPDKEAALLDIFRRSPEGERLLGICEVRRLAREALTTTDAAQIDQLYATGEPRIWRALADNRSVPRHLLDKLAAARGVKFAAEIRDRARRNGLAQ